MEINNKFTYVEGLKRKVFFVCPFRHNKINLKITSRVDETGSKSDHRSWSQM